jgi:cytochrome c biogenesis protein CcdA
MIKQRLRLRPSRPTSIVATIVGLVMVAFGLFLYASWDHPFVLVWIAVAIAITGFHAVNAFSRKGVATSTIESETSGDASPRPIAERLQELEQLRGAGLIKEVEYQRKREDILSGL